MCEVLPLQATVEGHILSSARNRHQRVNSHALFERICKSVFQVVYPIVSRVTRIDEMRRGRETFLAIDPRGVALPICQACNGYANGFSLSVQDRELLGPRNTLSGRE